MAFKFRLYSLMLCEEDSIKLYDDKQILLTSLIVFGRMRGQEREIGGGAPSVLLLGATL